MAAMLNQHFCDVHVAVFVPAEYATGETMSPANNSSTADVLSVHVVVGAAVGFWACMCANCTVPSRVIKTKIWKM